MLNGKMTIEEYHELGEFAVHQIDKFNNNEIDIYDLVAIITLNSFDKGCQSFKGVTYGK